MKKRTLRKVISLLLCIGMTFTFMYAPLGVAYADENTIEEVPADVGTEEVITEEAALTDAPVADEEVPDAGIVAEPSGVPEEPAAADEPETGGTRADGSVWAPLDNIAAAAASDKPIAITMTNGSNTWVLPAAKATGAPMAVAATVTDGKLNTSGAASDYGWTITESNGKYTIVNNGGLYLYVTAANNGVRINTKPDTGHEWSITSNYLSAVDSNAATRYLGVYNNQDWRCYTNTTGNISGQTLKFWELETGGQGEYLPLIEDESIFDGAKVVICHPDSGMALTATASGSKLLGAAASFNDDDELGLMSSMAQLDVVEEDGVFTFTNSEGKYLTSGATGNSLTFATLGTNADLAKWTLEKQTDGTWVLTNVGAKYNGATQYLEYYNGFTTYGMSNGVTAAYKFEFYGTNGTGETPQGPFTVTITQAEHGTITASKTADIAYNEEITITMTPDEGYVADKLFVNGAAFNPAATDGVVTVKITRDTTVTGEFKEETPEPPATGLAKLTEAPLDGAKVVIYYPASQLAMTATASGNKLAGTAATVTDGVLTPTDAMAQLDVTVDNGVYTFTNSAGKYLTSGATGNSLTFADAESDYSKWTLEQQADGTWYVINLNAVYNNNKQALEYYNGFTTYGVKANNSAYKFEFYGTQGVEKLSKITFAPQNGANLVIYYPASQLVMTSTASGNKLAGTAATLENNKLVVTEEMARLDVTLADGVYTFKNAEGKYLTSGATGNSLTFADAESDYSKWTLEQQADGTWYVINLNAVYNNNKQALEYYNGFTTYGVKANNSAYKFEFYGTSDEPTEPPTGDTFGLASTLATGDEVIIFNEANKKGVSSTMSGTYYLSGKEYTPVDGVITTGDTDVVWTVTKNDDGTYLFKQGDKTLGGVQTTNSSTGAIYNNIDLSGSSATKWTMEAAGTGVYLYLGELPSSKEGGHIYFDWYASKTAFSLVDYANPGTNTAFMFTFYKKGAEPEQGDLVTSLDQLTDGTTVAIYNQKHMTAISNKPNGDWYLKANPVVMQNGKITQFTEDNVWTVKKNDDGTYTFYAYGDENRSIAVWSSTVGENTYAEMTVDSVTYPDDSWTLTPAATANCFYFKSATVTYDNKPAYINAYTNYGVEFFRGSFTTSINEDNMALQFYLINPEDATPPFDDGTWDGILTPGEQYVVYNETADAVLGLFKEANYAYDAIPTEFTDTNPVLAIPGNGAYAFTVGSTGRYYTFKIGDKYMASNDEEELYLEELHDGQVPDNAKWFLWKNGTGYVIYNKEANYKGSNVCIEYFSSVFSGWTYKNKTKDIFLFNFYKVSEDSFIHENIVQAPSVLFDCEDYKYFEQDMPVTITLDDLCDDEENPPQTTVTITAGSHVYTVDEEDIEYSADKKNLTFTLLAADIDQAGMDDFTISVSVTNGFGLTYSGEKIIEMIDTPFFENMTPKPNAQTGDEKKPVVSVKIGNVGPNPTFTMELNDVQVPATYDPETKTLSFTPTEDMEDGRVHVYVKAVREDGVSSDKQWSFTVGVAPFQLYFGQLHSHTTYSDGSGTLDTALDYIASLPESANVQFVAFTDHSNYFDTVSAANPADALNDKSLMLPASREVWEGYKNTVAKFNSKHDDLIAIAGFEMTWSGGPGHINTFDSEGLVSRNNAALNDKNGDAGMKLYYETINKGDSLSQFNHPGDTFGNFTDFSYRDEETDDHMFLVEVGNGEGQIGAGGYYPSYEQYTLALDRGWHLAPTNNQDNHKGRWGNANNARDVVLTNDFSEDGIYEAIRNRRVYATEDKNLQITYTVNGEPMGTIFSEIPEAFNAEVTLYDPDDRDLITKVELVTNGGVTAYTWTDESDIAEGYLTASISPDYNYYFVRVTQKDGDLAVTAPVWTGRTTDLGIENLEAVTDPVYKGEAATLKTTLFNHEETAGTLKSLTYTINGSTVIGTDTTERTLGAGATLEVPFTHTFDKAKLTEVKVTAVINYGGIDFNFTYKTKIDVLDRATENTVTPIADVRAASDPNDTGYRFILEGVLTSNASGYDKDTAFFDCVYVQDETGGICIFPVSGEYKVGDKVRVIGHTDFYQGEPELQVQSIEVIGTGEIQPTEVLAKQITNRSVEGKLVTLKGTVESFEVVNGLIQTIMVKDAAGSTARVFIDGYITTQNEVKNCAVDAPITVTGLASYDNTFNAPDGPFPRIRVRDRADVVIEGHVHDLTKVEAKAATCVAEGNIEYWVCSACGAYFSDENGEHEIALSDTVIPIDPNAHQWNEGVVTVPPTFEADGELTYTCTLCGHTTTEPITKYGFTVTVDGVEMTDVEIVENGYDASYEDWTTGDKVESLIPLAVVTVPAGTTAAKVTLNNHASEYNTYYYTREPDASGYTQYIDYGIGEMEEVLGMQMPVAHAGIAYDATVSEDQVIRVQTKYDENWVSLNLYAIAFEYAEEPEADSVLRIFGDGRYETAFKVADELKERLGVEKFDAVILAYGSNYPDALAGSYLSCVLDAPILLVNSQEARIAAAQEYINENLKAGGSVYMLGGTGVVPDAAVEGLTGFETVRLGGDNRYETNLKILEEAAKFDSSVDEVLVCTGSGFADSLSAAAVGKPIMLVGKTLRDDQKEYLAGFNGDVTLTAVGGTGAVSEDIMEAAAAYGTTDRVAGDNRYLTSTAVAQKYFDEPKAGVLANGSNFPDGLCGGALASAIGGPLVLTNDKNMQTAADYAAANGMKTGIVLGGPTLISDDSVKAIFQMGEEDEIIVK